MGGGGLRVRKGRGRGRDGSKGSGMGVGGLERAVWEALIDFLSHFPRFLSGRVAPTFTSVCLEEE